MSRLPKTEIRTEDMGIITWIVIIGGTLFLLYYGFNLLVRKPGVGDGSGDSEPVVACHLCRRTYPISQTVSRDRIAGIVSYFCPDCIEGLYNDYVSAQRDGRIGPVPDVESISRN